MRFESYNEFFIDCTDIKRKIDRKTILSPVPNFIIPYKINRISLPTIFKELENFILELNITEDKNILRAQTLNIITNIFKKDKTV